MVMRTISRFLTCVVIVLLGQPALSAEVVITDFDAVLFAEVSIDFERGTHQTDISRITSPNADQGEMALTSMDYIPAPDGDESRINAMAQYSASIGDTISSFELFTKHFVQPLPTQPVFDMGTAVPISRATATMLFRVRDGDAAFTAHITDNEVGDTNLRLKLVDLSTRQTIIDIQIVGGIPHNVRQDVVLRSGHRYRVIARSSNRNYFGDEEQIVTWRFRDADILIP